MRAQVTEVADAVFRISVFHADYGIQFVHYLVRDDEPFLMHTGLRAQFPAVLDGMRQVMDPALLRWIGFSHFEADECGALNEWFGVAPHAQAVCGVAGVMLSLADQSPRPSRALADDEVLDIGRHRLRYLCTPHLPHGLDAGMFFEETDGTLFCSDLFFQAGDLPALSEADIMDAVRAALVAKAGGPLAADLPWTARTAAQLTRLASLQPRTLAVMHGSTYRGDGAAALRELSAALEALPG